MKKPSLKKRFSYWFDNRMSKSSLGLIRLLAIVTIIIILVVAVIVAFCGFNEEDGFLAAFWDSLATVINAWLPYYGDGSAGYLILMTIAAIAGLLITSVLIGIIASAIEEKITNLKKGNSEVLEKGHIVVLGFTPGEFTLLEQLVAASGDDKTCIVVASDMDQEEMNDSIRDNVEHPRNVRIISRTIDIFDPVALQKLAVTDARSVIINPSDDLSSTRALLAVSKLINSTDTPDVHISSITSESEYTFPASAARQHNAVTLHTRETTAKIIAHSCTQPGLSETFYEFFNFEGSELFIINIPKAARKTFEELTMSLEGAVPVGIRRDGEIRVNPPADQVLSDGDEIIVFAETARSARLLEEAFPRVSIDENAAAPTNESCCVSILGANSSIGIIINELPANACDLILANVPAALKDEIIKLAGEREGLHITFEDGDISSEEALTSFAERSDHVILLSDHEKGEDESDMDTIFKLIKLRDIRSRTGFKFNITAEMMREYNQRLAASDDNTDFVIASNMSSLLLAQLAENPDLLPVFKELLSLEGNELYLKAAGSLQCEGTHTAAQLRSILLQQGYIFIGYYAEGGSTFNPPLNETITLEGSDIIIVIGEE